MLPEQVPEIPDTMPRRLKEKALLDANHHWPTEYLFKFILLADQVDELLEMFGSAHVTLRPSRNGRYICVSARMNMSCSDEVLYMYQIASKIEGIISL